MDRYVCYYCQKACEDYPELIKHLCLLKHANDIVKYRERDLDSASGRLGYRTKYFQDIIPSKCEISVTRDNRLSISNVARSKKKKTNTHLREPKIQLIIMEMMDKPVGNPHLICWRKWISLKRMMILIQMTCTI